ncbi:unnamed protein product [Pararhodospirillum photometricum DSM 122]|uniref:Uncharacterized protein n=1 Tax=Pararhodospirillum photometricum DSM 122 TaxID=1150469 RepID=H6SLB5_PARPM|nr:unnamed protein product [Pararhodospirillum photometricum DSM 122]
MIGLLGTKAAVALHQGLGAFPGVDDWGREKCKAESEPSRSPGTHTRTVT